MVYGSANSKWWSTTITLAALAALSAFRVFKWRKKSRDLEREIHDLKLSANAWSEQCAAERQGRIRAQQALRKALAQQSSDVSRLTSYPMIPIAFVQSCFSTRNGTPRQPLLVPLARACVVLDLPRIPPEALEGLAEYSHCWILYVFHLNTDLEKLWEQPSNPKFKAKVRVPKLNGGKMGVLATRSPHRPCPIGLTVAKVEAVHRQMILLSGVDLVDGTPVLDIKPYLPYSDSIQGATVPKWVTTGNSLAVSSVNFSPDFSSSLTRCWVTMESRSLYSSDEFRSLIKQVLSWDIRSLSQRNRPHNSLVKKENDERKDLVLELQEWEPKANGALSKSEGFLGHPLGDVTYHLILEGVDVSYRIDSKSNLIVEKADVYDVGDRAGNRCSYMMWREIVGRP